VDKEWEADCLSDDGECIHEYLILVEASIIELLHRIVTLKTNRDCG
jgi:hypothetical protein